jgi:hypothetical protein
MMTWLMVLVIRLVNVDGNEGNGVGDEGGVNTSVQCAD